MSKEESGISFRVGVLWGKRFAARTKNLPEELQDVFLDDLETAIDERLKALERSVKHGD